MKVLRIVSSRSQVPLAEVRTDGRVLDFIVDNTEGSLPKICGKSYKALLDLVHKSSHLSVEMPEDATPSLLRYVLNNGDSVEITTDGKTAILNGKLLSEEEKNALFAAIKRGDISVAHKADPTKPVPSMQPLAFKKPLEIQPDKKQESFIKKQIFNIMNQRQKQIESGSSSFDYSIESAGMGDTEDPEFVKKMLYFLKYGDNK